MAKSQYGEVFRAELVVEVPTKEREQDGIKWKATGQKCVVKMSNLQQMSNVRSLEVGNGIVLPEDPLRENYAMQYMKDFHFYEEDSNGLKIHECLLEEDHVQEFLRIRGAIIESHVMLPYDIVQDNENLFLVMPDVGGTQMFHWLQDKMPNRLDTDEAKCYFTQMLNCIELLQRAGVCHRDISFENLLRTPDGVIVLFDFGMCLKIPCLEGEGLDHRNWTRCLMTYQRPSWKVRHEASCN
jgi:serine/threonine protein kinase